MYSLTFICKIRISGAFGSYCTDDSSSQLADILKRYYMPTFISYYTVSAEREREILFEVSSHHIQVCPNYHKMQYETYAHISRSQAIHNHKSA
jgi:hypothetical protein